MRVVLWPWFVDWKFFQAAPKKSSLPGKSVFNDSGTTWDALAAFCLLSESSWIQRGLDSNAPGRSQDEPKGCREEQNGAERNLRGAKSKLKVAKREPKEPKGCQKLAKDSQRSLKGNQKGSQRAIKIHPNIDKNFMPKSMPPRRENGWKLKVESEHDLSGFRKPCAWKKHGF